MVCGRKNDNYLDLFGLVFRPKRECFLSLIGYLGIEFVKTW